MDELISRKALRERLDALSEIFRRRGENEDKGFIAIQCGVTFADCEVREAPTIDAVEVVRCGECKNSSRIASDYTDRMRHCWNGRGANKGDGFSRVKSDGYCDEGARMDGEGEKDG